MGSNPACRSSLGGDEKKTPMNFEGGRRHHAADSDRGEREFALSCSAEIPCADQKETSFRNLKRKEERKRSRRGNLGQYGELEGERKKIRSCE